MPPDRGREAVVYWMIGARRAAHSFALDRAVELARGLDKPLIVVEPLRAGYRWANDRLHTFVIQGMRDNAAAFLEAGVGYHPYIEPEPGAGKGLIQALGRRAAVVVTDEALGFFQPRMIASAARQLREVGTRLEVVDGNGLVPVRATDKAYPTAYAFRRALQKLLPLHVTQRPGALPFDGPRLQQWTLPDAIAARWPAADLARLDVAGLPIDHGVAPVRSLTGGARAGQARLRAFVQRRLSRYDERSNPDADSHSGLSPWLHFGHVSAHEVFAAVIDHERWTPDKAGGVTNGSREGFWGMSPQAEGFLDELVTWRELALNGAMFLEHHDSYAGNPAWAHKTLAEHAQDARPVRYSLEELEAARTHDEVWNAAQRQLLEEGVIHNYLRMLWGKKVLEWSASPQEAFDILVHLNNKYALDGRDASSSAGIAWCFGRYDRPWAPIRPIFGSIRYMASGNTLKKLKMKGYMAQWGRGQRGLGAQRGGG